MMPMPWPDDATESTNTEQSLHGMGIRPFPWPDYGGGDRILISEQAHAVLLKESLMRYSAIWQRLADL